MKIILTTVTLHVKDNKRSKDFKYDRDGGLISGRLVVIDVPPDTAVGFEDEDEAARIVDRHGGEYVADREPAIIVPAHVDEVDNMDVISLKDSLKKASEEIVTAKASKTKAAA